MDPSNALYILQLQLASDQFTLLLMKLFAWNLATVCNWYPSSLSWRKIPGEYLEKIKKIGKQKMKLKNRIFESFFKKICGDGIVVEM